MTNVLVIRVSMRKTRLPLGAAKRAVYLVLLLLVVVAGGGGEDTGFPNRQCCLCPLQPPNLQKATIQCRDRLVGWAFSFDSLYWSWFFSSANLHADEWDDKDIAWARPRSWFCTACWSIAIDCNSSMQQHAEQVLPCNRCGRVLRSLTALQKPIATKWTKTNKNPQKTYPFSRILLTAPVFGIWKVEELAPWSYAERVS